MPQWLKTDFSIVKLRCPREPHKIAEMQLRTDVYQGNIRVLSPFMNCHNEYGLTQCNTVCKKHLYDYLTSPGDSWESPIELDLILSEPY